VRNNCALRPKLSYRNAGSETQTRTPGFLSEPGFGDVTVARFSLRHGVSFRSISASIASSTTRRQPESKKPRVHAQKAESPQISLQQVFCGFSLRPSAATRYAMKAILMPEIPLQPKMDTGQRQAERVLAGLPGDDDRRAEADSQARP
jgi:hypothetical protein